MRTHIPEINLAYLKAMTDSFALFQHAKFSRPNKKTGYALDDNARALIVAIELDELELAKKYLKFIKFCQARNGMFHNKISWQRKKRHAPDIGILKQPPTAFLAALIITGRKTRIKAPLKRKSTGWAKKF